MILDFQHFLYLQLVLVPPETSATASGSVENKPAGCMAPAASSPPGAEEHPNADAEGIDAKIWLA